MMHPFKRACLAPGCPELVEKGRCPKHQAATPQRSPEGQQRHKIYDAIWRRSRAAYLMQNPLCVDPYSDHGPIMPATVVDHIQPHRGNLSLFWNVDNW